MSCEGSVVLGGAYREASTECSASATMGDRALTGLDGTALSERFRSWRGRSGRRYVFSVFRDAIDGSPPCDPGFPDAVVIAASREADGARRMVRITSTEGYPELFFHGRAMAEAKAAGATELHVHLLASSKAERRAVVEDLQLSL